MKPELEFARAVSCVGVTDWLPCPTIPQHDSARAVLALRNNALKCSVVHRMVFHMNRQSFYGWIQARPLRNRPTFEDAIQLKPKIVMKTAGRVFLDNEQVARRTVLGSLRLRRSIEMPF